MLLLLNKWEGCNYKLVHWKHGIYLPWAGDHYVKYTWDTILPKLLATLGPAYSGIVYYENSKNATDCTVQYFSFYRSITPCPESIEKWKTNCCNKAGSNLRFDFNATYVFWCQIEPQSLPRKLPLSLAETLREYTYLVTIIYTSFK